MKIISPGELIKKTQDKFDSWLIHNRFKFFCKIILNIRLERFVLWQWMKFMFSHFPKFRRDLKSNLVDRLVKEFTDEFEKLGALKP